MFPSLDERREAPTLLGPLDRARPSQCAQVSTSSRLKTVTSSFRNVVFPSYLRVEFRGMGEVHKPSDSECYAPLSEPIRFWKKPLFITALHSEIRAQT
jgi:hypothetical protein